MSKKQPLVSVIITNYNYAQYVGEAIESVLAQTYKNIEIIVIDDGSTDDSDKIIKNYAKKHKTIRYLPQKNTGVIGARNKGLDAYRGAFVMFLDGDDKLPGDYVESLVELMEREGVDLAYTDYQRFGDQREESNFPEFDLIKLTQHNYIHASAMLRASVIGAHRFDTELNQLSHEDWEFFLGIALGGAKAKKVGTTKLLYRAHGSSRSLQLEGEAHKEAVAKQALKTVKALLYIRDKYNKIYPGSMEISVESELIQSTILSIERLHFIEELRRINDEQQRNNDSLTRTLSRAEQTMAEKDAEIQARDDRMQTLLSSKAYKIGSKLLTPARGVRRAVRMGRKK